VNNNNNNNNHPSPYYRTTTATTITTTTNTQNPKCRNVISPQHMMMIISLEFHASTYNDTSLRVWSTNNWFTRCAFIGHNSVSACARSFVLCAYVRVCAYILRTYVRVTRADKRCYLCVRCVRARSLLFTFFTFFCSPGSNVDVEGGVVFFGECI